MESFSINLGKRILYCGCRGSGKSTSLQLIASMISGNSQPEFEIINLGGSNLWSHTIVNPRVRTLRESPGFDQPVILHELAGALEDSESIERLVSEVDGIVFVSDSSSAKRVENISAMKMLRSEVERQGGAMKLPTDDPTDQFIPGKPIVLQHNKRDIPDCMTIAEMESELNWRNFASFDSVATQGQGVFATLIAVVRLTLTSAC